MEFLRTIYLYIVSFVSLMITLTAVITSFNAISDIIIPESDVTYSGYNDYSYTETFIDEGFNAGDHAKEVGGTNTKSIVNQNEIQRTKDIKRAQKRLINSFASALVGGFTFWFHWSKIEKDHKKIKFKKNDSAVTPE